MFIKLCVGVLLVINSVIDIKSKKVSVGVLLFFITIWFPYYIATRFLPIYSVAGGIIIGLCIIGISKVSKGGIGMGDGMLLCVLGGYLGVVQTLKLLFAALCLAAGVSIILMVVKRVGRKTELPFVPFLCAAYIGSILMQVIQ